jgi:hypothetical protein
MEDQLFSFVEKFFTNLGANIVFQNDILTISNVPAEFQKYYGKSEPYNFTLDKDRVADDVEILEKGSYTMKALNSYLENSGQTTLLKIDFDIDPVIEIKKRLKLSNARLMKLVPKKRHSIFFRFTFHTSFQYLNERDKIINEIYIHDGKVVNGNLDTYPVIEGQKSDIRIPDMKEPYFVAKEELKDKLKWKTAQVAEDLNIRLKKEIQRIEDHFKTEGDELMDNIKKAVEKLNELAIEGEEIKIQRQKKALHNLKERLDPKEREKDKERSIMIEKNKHGLNVNTKLFNTTLIYHPLFTYNAHLNTGTTEKAVEIVFDPLLENLKEIECSSCKEVLNEINLCEAGHVSCKSCFTRCESCGKEYCKDCISTTCDLCNHSICEACRTKCYGCKKIICKTHTHFDKLTAKIYCNNCLTRCERCERMKVGDDFHTSEKTGVEICGDCFRTEMKDKVLDSVF